VYRIFPNGHSITIGNWLRLVLAVQLVIVALLIAADVSMRWEFTGTSPKPSIESPVSPGDQVRKYQPVRPRVETPDTDLDYTIDQAADQPTRLVFSIRQSSDLKSVLHMHGKIAQGDANRFSAYLETLDSPPDTVAVNSTGGIVDEALQIGLIIREQEFNTHLSAREICLSACPYILAGGIERRVSHEGIVGLHQHYYETPGFMPVFLAVENIQRGQGRTMAHLIEMGIDPGVMIHSLTTPPDDIYVLVEDELIASKMATQLIE